MGLKKQEIEWKKLKIGYFPHIPIITRFRLIGSLSRFIDPREVGLKKLIQDEPALGYLLGWVSSDRLPGLPLSRVRNQPRYARITNPKIKKSNVSMSKYLHSAVS
jgi:hypothetical protein